MPRLERAASPMHSLPSSIWLNSRAGVFGECPFQSPQILPAYRVDTKMTKKNSREKKEINTKKRRVKKKKKGNPGYVSWVADWNEWTCYQLVLSKNIVSTIYETIIIFWLCFYFLKHVGESITRSHLKYKWTESFVDFCCICLVIKRLLRKHDSTSQSTTA